MAGFLDFLISMNFWEICYQHTFAYRSGSTRQRIRNVFFRWYLILCNTVWQEIKWVLFMCQLSFKSCLFSKNFLSTQNWCIIVIDKVMFNFETGVRNRHFGVPGHYSVRKAKMIYFRVVYDVQYWAIGQFKIKHDRIVVMNFTWPLYVSILCVLLLTIVWDWKGRRKGCC